MDYVSNERMLLGGEMNMGSPYPYFEIYYFTGSSKGARYITDSSLKRIKSIKYH